MRFSLIFGLLIAALLGYAVYWFMLADQIEVAVRDWTRQQREDGVSISYDALEIGGFPYRMQVELRNLRIGTIRTDAQSDGQRDWRWQTPLLVGNVLPYRLDHIVLRAPEPQEFMVTRKGETDRSYRLTPDIAQASLVLDDGQIERLAIDVSDARLSGSDIEDVALGRVQLHARQVETQGQSATLELALQAENIRYQPLSDTALGPVIEAARIKGALTGTAFHKGLSLLTEQGQTPGSFQLTDLQLRWGALDLDAAGTVGLDAENRPEGALTTRISGYNDILTALQHARQLTPEEAQTAQTALNLIALTAGRGDNTLSLPLVMRDGDLLLGPVRIARLPQIALR